MAPEASTGGSIAMPTVGALVWQPHLPPLVCALAIAALAGSGVALYRRILTRMSAKKAALLMIPRVLLLALLVVALLEPLWSVRHRIRDARQVLLLTDVSSSMDLRDTDEGTRAARARDIAERLKRRLSGQVRLLEFDTDLREPGESSPARTRGTDLGGCLLALSERSDLSSYAALVLLTDGGDEAVESARLPGVPLHVVGVGSDLSRMDDLAISEVQFPVSVENGVDFEIVVDLRANVTPGNSQSAPDLKRRQLTLEREENGAWKKHSEKTADLSNRRARLKFGVLEEDPGLARFRLRLEPLEHECSSLNNARTFSIEVRRKSLHVLFFTRELGAQLKMMRSELAADPGVTFTALFRTIGERFTVQGERVGGDDLQAGFPRSADDLERFDCVIVGSFPAEAWVEEQMEALVRYAEKGGAVIFLGGQHSFAQGDYEGTPLAALFPWDIAAGGRELLRGAFPVSIPAGALNHPIVYGLASLLLEQGQVTVESANPTGDLKPGATALMNAGLGSRITAIVAVQQFGNGRILAVASNTLWKWARQASAVKEVYGTFWRQAVRNLAGPGEGGELLSVKWDRVSYRAGEQAVARIRVPRDRAEHLRLKATLAMAAETRQIPVTPLPGQARAFEARLLFKKRGTHRFVLSAYDGETLIESYEKVFPIVPLLDEGTRLEVDSRFLQQLAEKGAGMYVPETETDRLLEHLTRDQPGETMVSETSLVRGSSAFALCFLAVLVAEWILRRALNLF